MNKIYLKGKECLGKDMSRTESTYGCVQALAAVFKFAIGQELGENLSTTKLYRSLLIDKRFKQVFNPIKGDIILSPTGYGQGNGHTGIISDNPKIMSANSITDKWDEHLDMQTWHNRYASFPVLFFRYIMDVEDIEQKKISILQKIVSWSYTRLLSANYQLKNNMNNSKLFRINYKDLITGLVVACLSAMFLKLATALNVPGFSFSSYDWAGLLQVAIAAGVGYISQQFFRDSEGTPLGKADKAVR